LTPQISNLFGKYSPRIFQQVLKDNKKFLDLYFDILYFDNFLKETLFSFSTNSKSTPDPAILYTHPNKIFVRIFYTSCQRILQSLKPNLHERAKTE